MPAVLKIVQSQNSAKPLYLHQIQQYEAYILKHASHYVQPGARVLDLGGSYDEALGFVNPDGRTVLLLANKEAAPKTVSVELGGRTRTRTFSLPAESVNTLVLK